MTVADKSEKKLAPKFKKALQVLLPGGNAVSAYDAKNVTLPATSAGYFDGIINNDYLDPVKRVFASVSDDEKLIQQLPVDRIAKYPFLESMAEDPLIDSALKMHISHALSADDDTNEVLKIESTTDSENAIVKDLRDTFKDTLNEKVQGWAFTAAKLGISYIRAYGEPGKGVTHIRNDFYTHPRFVREFEQSGKIAGFTSAYQEESNTTLMEPWKFVAFKVPFWKKYIDAEPYRVDSTPIDLSNDDHLSESICETQNYGSSLIETAYHPWFNLQEAMLSLMMSRKNAAKLERLIGVNMGRLDSAVAARYLRQISQVIQKTQQDSATKSIKRGWVQTVSNILIPILGGDGKGRLDVNSVEGSPDIQGIEDVLFWVKLMGAALGVDPSLLGFGDLLSGGLGEGGYFRMSILAAQKAHALRTAIRHGIERLFEVHIAYKYGKVFLPGQKPWRLMFNSVSTALEREERENLEGRTNIALAIAGLPQMLDPEMSITDKRAMANFLMTDVMKVDEEKFNGMFPEELYKKAMAAKEKAVAEGGGMGGGGMFESAISDSMLQEKVYKIIENFYHKENGWG